MGDLIERKGTASGRAMKEDDTIVNVAELIEALKTATEAVQAKLNAGITTTLTGSIPEFGWVDGDAEPTPTEFSFGAKVNHATGEITTIYWDGTAWEEMR